MMRWSPARVGAVLAAVVALGLAACAGSGEPAASTGGSSAGSTGSAGETTATESVVAITEGAFRPRLTWPDLGAERYAITVFSGTGAAWSWEGSETEVIVGAVPEVDWLGPGFALEGPAELWFAAFDADGAVLHSERGPLG